MRPQSIGRALGIGLRVAGRIAGQRLGNHSGEALSAARQASQTTRNVGRGVSGFLKPFRTVGGKIWLEVTGALFLLPVVAFVPVLWRDRGSWQQGPDHRAFLSAAVIVLVFSYLGITSFWRAGRRR